LGESRPQAPEKPFLRFYHAEALRAKTLGVLAALEQAQDRTRHRNALTDIVMELTDSGLDYFFIRPLKLANAGFVVEQSAQLGMVGVKRVMGPVIRNIIGQMSAQQLLAVSAHIRALME
jgi:hypothetical protein